MRADFSLDYDVLTVQQPQRVYLLARFVAGEIQNDLPRLPLNLSLVIDRSGSMAGEKLDYTRQSAQFLVQHLGAQDTFSIVLYDNLIETLIEPQIISNKDSINDQINKIFARGTTNLSGGWLQGCQNVKTHLAKNSLNRVILMSDGRANRGITDINQLTAITKQQYDEGVSTTTMGLGDDFNEDLLMTMAQYGGGAFYYIESPEVAPEIFQEELRGLLNVIGQNLNISIKADKFISGIKQLNSYPETQGEAWEKTFLLGDIYSNEVKTLVIELSIPSIETMGEIEVGQIRFSYDEISSSGIEHRIHEMPIKVNIQAESVRELHDIDVAKEVLLLKAAEARRQAIETADKGNYEEASRMLEAIADEIASAEFKNEVLTEEEKSLRSEAEKIGEFDTKMRKMMHTQAFYTSHNRHDETQFLRVREQKRQGNSETHIQDPNAPNPTHIEWKDKTYALDKDLIRIGRSKHNEIILDTFGVSRFHCQLKKEQDQFFLEDLGSTNGTQLNKINIEKPLAVKSGDVIHICDEKLRFIDQNKSL